MDDPLENRLLEVPVCGLRLWGSLRHAKLGRRAIKAAEGKARLKVTALTPSTSDQLRLAVIVSMWRRKQGNQVGNQFGKAISKAKGC